MFDLKGTPLTQFGERGFGPGQFNYPNDIAMDKRGRIYITDRENNQVQVWGWPVAEPPIPVPQSPLAVARRGAAPAAAHSADTACPPQGPHRGDARLHRRPRAFGEIAPSPRQASVSSRPRRTAPLYEGREIDGVKLGELLTFEEYSESDARRSSTAQDRAERGGAALDGLAREGARHRRNDLRLLALLAEVRTVDVAEFREIYLGRENASSEARTDYLTAT